VYLKNCAWDANKGDLLISYSPHVFEGNQGLAFNYVIHKSTSDNYCGFDRRLLSHQNWQGFSRLCLWVESDGSSHDLVVQFAETNGEVWKTTRPLTNIGKEVICIPLSRSYFFLAAHSPTINDQIDLTSIDQYGIYVHGAQRGAGVIYLDYIHLE